MRNNRSLLIRAVALIGLAGAPACTYPVELAASTTPLEPGAFTRLGPAEGSSRGFSFLVMFQFGADDPVQMALDDALENSGGDALVNVSVDQTDFHLLFLCALHRTDVRGTAVDLSGR